MHNVWLQLTLLNPHDLPTTSKVNCKNISEFLSKKFPIDFQSPIDFSQSHMIRPKVQGFHELHDFFDKG